jgi:hypothetical protein
MRLAQHLQEGARGNFGGPAAGRTLPAKRIRKRTMLIRRTEGAAHARQQTVRKLLGAVDWRVAVAFVAPLVLYSLTLAPTIYNLDSAELTTAAATGGLTRATGYPLYLILGGLWSHLPVGDVGFRLNLLSAVAGALTIALADRILRRLNVGPWAALPALGLLATAPFFWALALIAEVYTLHTALMAAIILLLLRWRDRPTPARLAQLTLLGGLSMGHHLATALLVPACALFVLGVAPRRALAPRAMAAAVAGGLLGLSIYAYLPLRSLAEPAFNYAGTYDSAGAFHPVDLRDPRNLWWLVTGRSFAGQMLGYSPLDWLREAGGFGVQLARSFFAVGIGPGLLGLAVLLRRDRWLGLALLLMFLANAVFYIGYRVIDKNTMYLPTYLVWALWAGVGCQWLLDWVGTGWDRPLLRGLFAGAVAAALAWNWPLTDQSRNVSARERGEGTLAAAEPGALILGYWQTVPLVEYLKLVEGRRPDVQAINLFLIAPHDTMTLIATEAGRRPVYIDSPTTELLRDYRVEPAGPIYRVLPRDEP